MWQFIIFCRKIWEAHNVPQSLSVPPQAFTLQTPFHSMVLSAGSIFVLMCIFYDMNLYLESLSVCTSHFLTWLQRSFLRIPSALTACSSVSSRQMYSGDKWTNTESIRTDGKKSSSYFFFFKVILIKHCVWDGTNSVLSPFVWIMTFKVEIIEKYFEVRLSPTEELLLFI